MIISPKDCIERRLKLLNFSIKNNTMNKIAKQALIISVISFVLTACCGKTEYPDISWDDKQWLPYPEGALVKFKHSATGQEMAFTTFKREYSQSRRGSPCPVEMNTSEGFDLSVVDSIPMIDMRCDFSQSSKDGFIMWCGPFQFFNSVKWLPNFDVMGTTYPTVVKSSIIPDDDDRYSSCYLAKGIGIVRLDLKNSPDYLYLVP